MADNILNFVDFYSKKSLAKIKSYLDKMHYYLKL